MEQKNLIPQDDRGGDPYHNQEDGGQGTDNTSSGVPHGPGKAIASMVMGVCSVSLWFVPLFTSIPCMIVGFIAVRMAQKEEEKGYNRYNGFIRAGKITGTIGLIVSTLYSIFMAAVFGHVIQL